MATSQQQHVDHGGDDNREEADQIHLPEPDERLRNLLRRKRVVKTQLTKSRLGLMASICNEVIDQERLRYSVRQVLATQEEVIDILLELCDIDQDKYEHELESIQADSSIIESVSKATDILKSTDTRNVPSPVSSNQETESAQPDNRGGGPSLQVDRDMFQQLRRVAIPKFDGNKKDYQLFRDAFYQCIDTATCSDGYKMLQLRQYLEGEALKAIEGFPASKVGYESAKKRLDDKYGGQRRTILMYLDSIRNSKQVNFQEFKMIQEFRDKLELAIIGLTELGRTEEFDENSMFYCVAKSKLPSTSIVNYKRWAATMGELENLSSLFKWLSTEVKFRTEAREEVDGLSVRNNYKPPTHFKNKSNYGSPRTYSTSNTQSNHDLVCKLCKRDHDLTNCPLFRSLPVNQRWEYAKSQSLCFRCLKDFHHGINCNEARQCGIDNCPKTHNRLLHGGDYRSPENIERINRVDTQPVVNSKARTHTSQNGDYVAMRTVPVVMHNGQIEHALLDECSTDSYIDSKLSEELCLTGPLTSLDVGVLGGKTTSINTSRVELNIRSVDCINRFNFKAFTVKNVTGDMTMLDWRKYVKYWPHLERIAFPTVGKNPRIRLLIGLNCPEVHRSITEIYGAPGEPCARLTPLGWTCIGPYEPLERRVLGRNHFARAFFVQEHRDTNKLIREMWELETMGVSNVETINLCDDVTYKLARSTINFTNNRYSVGIPWKEREPILCNNYDSAKRRLLNLEKSLAKKPDISESYRDIINTHILKGYVCEVIPPERHAPNIWYLPHFPVVRLDKMTTKVRIVLDAAARFNDRSLNDCISSGPKLQRELLDVLIRFRQGQIALAADITEMFLQIGMLGSD